MCERAYLDFEMEEGFYSVWNVVTSVLRWLIEFYSHDDGAQLVIEQSLPFRRLTWIVSGSDLMVHLSLQSTGGMVQRVADRL